MRVAFTRFGGLLYVNGWYTNAQPFEFNPGKEETEMTIRTWLLRILGAVLVTLIPFMAHAQNVVNSSAVSVENTGGSGIWIFANICYAGMRAQHHPGVFWRVISFIFGFPGTLLTLIVVEEGSERAYGIDLPRRANDQESVD